MLKLLFSVKVGCICARAFALAAELTLVFSTPNLFMNNTT